MLAGTVLTTLVDTIICEYDTCGAVKDFGSRLGAASPLNLVKNLGNGDEFLRGKTLGTCHDHCIAVGHKVSRIYQTPQLFQAATTVISGAAFTHLRSNNRRAKHTTSKAEVG